MRYQLDEWGVLYGCELSDTAAQIVAELAANAETHGRVSGRAESGPPLAPQLYDSEGELGSGSAWIRAGGFAGPVALTCCRGRPVVPRLAVPGRVSRALLRRVGCADCAALHP
ncbi:hypothetical protein GCM10009837_18910 [Streptomyces durmitorensis]